MTTESEISAAAISSWAEFELSQLTALKSPQAAQLALAIRDEIAACRAADGRPDADAFSVDASYNDGEFNAQAFFGGRSVDDGMDQHGF